MMDALSVSLSLSLESSGSSKYLNVVVVVIVLQLLAPVGRVSVVLPPRVERVHHDLLGALDFRPAEGATLSLGVHLPRREARRTQQMTARFDPDVLVVLGADLTQLERAPHFAVQFVLLLRHRDVVLEGTLHGERQIRIVGLPVRKQIEAFPMTI